MAETYRYWYSAEHDKANHTRWRGSRSELTNIYRDSVQTRDSMDALWVPYTLCFVVPVMDILRHLEATNQPTAEDKYRVRWQDAVLVHTSKGPAITSVEREPSLWRPWAPPSQAVARRVAAAESETPLSDKPRKFRLDVED